MSVLAPTTERTQWLVVLAIPLLTLLAPSALAQPLESEQPVAAAADGGEMLSTEPAGTGSGLSADPQNDGGEVAPAGLLGPDGGLPTAAPAPSAESPSRSPSFTQDRQFTTARLWVLDTGRYTLEQGWSGEWGVPRALAGRINQDDQLLQTEIGVGLLPHVELDLSANVELNQDGNGNYQISPIGLTGVSAELRIALGSYWDQIWGNPTLDLELWGRTNEPTRLEARVLLGGELLTPKLLGTVNLMFARNSFHDTAIGLDYEIKADLGASYEIIPDILRLGVEAAVGWDSHNTVSASDDSTLLHPAAQVGPVILLTEPHKRFKLLAAVLYGLADWDAPWQSQLIASTTF